MALFGTVWHLKRATPIMAGHRFLRMGKVRDAEFKWHQMALFFGIFRQAK
jgi:hypothetical protein